MAILWAVKFFVILLLILLLASCSGQNRESVEAVPTVVLRTVPERVPAEREISISSTSLATAVPPPTATPVPSSTAVPPATPTLEATATHEPQRLSFAVIGDYGTSGVGSQEVAALVNGWDPDLVLTVGDNNYPDGAAGTIAGNITQHYGRFIDEGRFFPTLGNHDVTTDFGRPYLEYFELPGNERYYEFVRGDVHFFAVNSDWREVDGISASSRQADWLREALAASTAPWQVVYFHAPPYVSMEAKEVPVLRWPFAQWGADLVLSGHAHLYERLQIDGLSYLISGLGGGGIYAFDDEPVLESQSRFNGDYGALLVEASASQLTTQFVTRAGVVVDRLTLNQ